LFNEVKHQKGGLGFEGKRLNAVHDVQLFVDGNGTRVDNRPWEFGNITDFVNRCFGTFLVIYLFSIFSWYKRARHYDHVEFLNSL